jgi:ABC-type transport system involved in cytochrome c biogenesis permease subunit
MGPNEINALHIVHVAAVLVLIAYTFYAFAAPPETRKRVLAVTGAAFLVLLLTGVRLWQGLYGFAPLGWIVVKLVCAVGITGLVGLAYRRRSQAGLLMAVVLGLAILAIAMVFTKPF